MTEVQDDFNYDEFDEALSQRAAESFARKDDTGKFRGILRETEGVKMWRPGEGSHIFDVIPYRCGEHDPRLKKGTLTYVLDLWVHYNVGATEDSFVCPARTYSDKKNPLHTTENCPICEHQNELRKELEKLEDADEIKTMEDQIKALNPKRRVLYNVLVLDSAQEEEKGVQIWDVAHWSMERHLSVLSEKKRGSSGASVGGHMPFASPKNGKSIAFTKKGKGINTEFLGHKFEDREGYTIGPELLKEAKCLDEEVVIPSYADLYLAFHGYELGEEAPIKTAAPAAVEEDDIPSERAEEQAAPAGRRALRTPAQDPEPAPETGPEKDTEAETAEVKDNKCPKGHVFGKDADDFPEDCNKCADELWQECATLKKKAGEKTEEKSAGRRLQRTA